MVLWGHLIKRTVDAKTIRPLLRIKNETVDTVKRTT
jgi:hypothetical protein